MLLKDDFTWEYIDIEKPKTVTDGATDTGSNAKESDRCSLTEDYIEPKLDKKIQSELKR